MWNERSLVFSGESPSLRWHSLINSDQIRHGNPRGDGVFVSGQARPHEAGPSAFHFWKSSLLSIYTYTL